MRRIAALLLAFLLAVTPALADSSFVAPTANGTAAVGQLPGTTTNDAASAGNIGELITGTAALASVSLTNVTAANAGSATLTAGDWEVTCAIYYLASGTTTVSSLEASISATSATRATTIGTFSSATFNAAVIGLNQYETIVTPPLRVSLSGSTIYYCVAYASFAVSTLSAGGVLHARRAR